MYFVYNLSSRGVISSIVHTHAGAEWRGRKLFVQYTTVLLGGKKSSYPLFLRPSMSPSDLYLFSLRLQKYANALIKNSIRVWRCRKFRFLYFTYVYYLYYGCLYFKLFQVLFSESATFILTFLLRFSFLPRSSALFDPASIFFFVPFWLSFLPVSSYHLHLCFWCNFAEKWGEKIEEIVVMFQS